MPLLLLATGLTMLCAVAISSYVLGRGVSVAAHKAARSPSTVGTSTSGVASVLAGINSARTQAFVAAYALSSGLEASSRQQNRLMAVGCRLPRMGPGELALGDREAPPDVRWTAAGQDLAAAAQAADRRDIRMHRHRHGRAGSGTVGTTPDSSNAAA